MVLQKLASVSIETFENVWPRDIVFLHGNLASRRWWYPTLEFMQKKFSTQRGRAFLIEFPGCGLSDSPKSLDDVNMESWAKTFNEAVGKLSNGPMDLVGHSTGGLVAALMAAEKPEFFQKAVLLDPVGARGVQFEPALLQAFEAMKVDRDLTAQVIGSTIYNLSVGSSYFNEILVPDAFHSVKEVGAWVVQSLSGADFRKPLANAKIPIQVLHGEFDQILPIQDSQDLANILPKGSFKKLMSAGHCLNVENPERFFGELQEFLLNS